MQIFAAFMFVGIFTTLLVSETKRMTLEEISYKVHDENNGWVPEKSVGSSTSAASPFRDPEKLRRRHDASAEQAGETEADV